MNSLRELGFTHLENHLSYEMHFSREVPSVICVCVRHSHGVIIVICLLYSTLSFDVMKLKYSCVEFIYKLIDWCAININIAILVGNFIILFYFS